MRSTLLRATLAFAVLVAAWRTGPACAGQPFAGPKGWDHTVSATPTPQAPRALETWKKPNGEFLTYLSDGALSYDDVIVMVKKNVSDNGIKTDIDADRKCGGRRAHELEMILGATVVDQIIVDDAPGVTRLTYSRPQTMAKSADVTSALTDYCGASQ
jgi:hypothetical protein